MSIKRTKVDSLLGKTAYRLISGTMVLLTLRAVLAIAGTEQDIRDAILERRSFSSQRLSELDRNHDGRVDVADETLNSIAEGILPAAGLWVVILTPDSAGAGGDTQFNILLSYTESGN